MATGEKWRKHFDKLTPARRKVVRNALETLEQDKMVQKEMPWLGTLKYMIKK